jgi:hypothetical protein
LYKSTAAITPFYARAGAVKGLPEAAQLEHSRVSAISAETRNL